MGADHVVNAATPARSVAEQIAQQIKGETEKFAKLVKEAKVTID